MKDNTNEESSGLSAYRDPTPSGPTVSANDLEAMGFPMPVVDPNALRAAFAERHRLLTSILDPERDFLYSIRYNDPSGKQKQSFTTSRERAIELADHVKGEWSAHPKKSGCLKLAHALGIESKRIEITGLPVDQRANYSSCRYLATHRRTGRAEEGQGYCDATEKGSKMNAHAIISTADTRAWCHAVLRCAGYDSVGAESMVDVDVEEVVTVITHEKPPKREKPALAAQTAPKTIVDEMSTTNETASASVAATAPAAERVEAVKETPAAQEQAAQPPAASQVRVNPDTIITNSMAAELSQLLLAKLGSKAKASAWLVEHAGVERSIYVGMDKFSSLKSKLEAMETP